MPRAAENAARVVAPVVLPGHPRILILPLRALEARAEISEESVKPLKFTVLAK